MSYLGIGGVGGLGDLLGGLGNALGSQAAMQSPQALGIHCGNCGCTKDGFHGLTGYCRANNGATVWRPNAAEVEELAQSEAREQDRHLAAAKLRRSSQMLAAFDWNHHSDLRYIDWFFSQWGFEPLEVPKEPA